MTVDTFIIVGVLAIGLSLLASSLQSSISSLDLRLARMERLQQRLAEHEGLVLVRPDLEPVRALLIDPRQKRGRLHAVKKYIDITGVGLAEASAAVDRIDRGEPS